MYPNEQAQEPDEQEYDDSEPTYDHKLERKNRRELFKKNGTCLPFYVVCYGVARRYGGREEGGWWYDVQNIMEGGVRKVYGFKDARKAVRQLMEEFPTCPRGRGSVIGGTDIYIKICATTEEFPEEWDGIRPRYS
jgi:hypothetical protein